MTERIGFAELPQGLVDGLNKSEVYLYNSGLDKKLMELIKYRVSQMNGCAFCLDMHHKEAIEAGEEELRLHSLAAWRECPFYEPHERAALALAEALTQPGRLDVKDCVYEELSAYYSKAEIANLTLAIAQINSWNRLNIAFRTTPGKYVVGQYA